MITSNNNVIRFPTERIGLNRVDELIEEGMIVSAIEEGEYVSSEERQRRNYELEDFLGMPYGTLDKVGGLK